MNKDRRSIKDALSRCLRLRCPACGRTSIVGSPFHIRDHCAACDALFKREDGFFVGAIMVNVAVTEFAVLVIYLISLPIVGPRFQTLLTVLFTVALLFPVFFYHHSWSIWLGLDYFVESLPKASKAPPPR